MKCKNVSDYNVVDYPNLKESKAARKLRSLVLGASITMSMVVVSCQKKEPEPTTPSLPVNAEKSDDKSDTPDSREKMNKKNNHPPVPIGDDKVQLMGNIRVLPKPKDSDNDGVPDTKDNCPNLAGPATLKGCPKKRHIPRPGGMRRPYPVTPPAPPTP